MAYTYTSTPLMSKIKIGNVDYFLKDKDLRAIVDGFNNDIVTGSIDATVTEGGQGFVKAGAIKSYVDAQVGTINKFDVKVVDALPAKPSAENMYILYLVACDHTSADSYDEYICVRSGAEGAYTYAFEKIGNTHVDLSDYLDVNATVAGVAFGADKAITAAELEAEGALNLKSLSHKDSASQTVTDYATGIEGATYTPAGEVSVSLKDADAETAASLTKGDYTPAGSVTGSVVANGSVALAKDNESGVQFGGTNAPSAVTIELSKTDVLGSVKTAGSVATFTEGEYHPATLNYAESDAFAKAGIVATYKNDAEDAECLVLSAAATGKASVISAFDGGSKDADTFNGGAMPTFENANVATGVTSAEAAAQVFTGDKYAATFTGASSNIDASFNGTKAENILVTGVGYKKSVIDSASFTGTEDTIAPTLTKGSKTITVQ